MQAISLFSLERHAGAYDTWPVTTRLYRDGAATTTGLPGYVIEAQYACAQGFVLVLSQDCPFEESCHVILLDAALQVRATCALQRPYQSFLLHRHWPIADDAIALHYRDDLVFVLQVVARRLGRGHRLRLRNVRDLAQVPGAEASVAGLSANAVQAPLTDAD